jgi:hypothetical protein
VPVYFGISFIAVEPPGVTRLGGLVVALEVTISGETDGILNIFFM